MRLLLLLILTAASLALSACSSGAAATSSGMRTSPAKSGVPMGWAIRPSPVEANVARQVQRMPIPPFNVLRLREVKCTVQSDKTLVLCAGIPVTKQGKKYPRTQVLFRLPTGPGDSQMIAAVCNQGHYGVQPVFNIYCAE
jgi:hypothetical protein